VLGRYGPLRSSAVLYGAVLTLLGIVYTVLWRHIARRCRNKSSRDGARLRARIFRNLLGAVGYPLGTMIAFVSPEAAVLVYLALALYYLFPERQSRAAVTAFTIP
jgi:uncharacterized membrane protein